MFLENFPNLSNNNSSFIYFDVCTHAPATTLKEIFDEVGFLNSLIFRSAHLGSVWKLIKNNYHIGSGVFHASDLLIKEDGRNLILFDHNLVPANNTGNSFEGDILWWPGFCWEKKQLCEDLMIYNPVDKSFEKANFNFPLFHPLVFEESGKPLSHYYLDLLQRLNLGGADCLSINYGKRRFLLKNILTSLITSVKNDDVIRLDYLFNRVVHYKGKVSWCSFKLEDNFIWFGEECWSISKFVDKVADLITLISFSSLNYIEKINSIFENGKYENCPYISKEFMLALMFIFNTVDWSDYAVHIHSGGYCMGGIPLYKKGYMNSKHTKNVLKKIYRILFESQILDRQHIMALIPAGLFSLGSFVYKDLEILNELIEDFSDFWSDKRLDLNNKNREAEKIVKGHCLKMSSSFAKGYRGVESGEDWDRLEKYDCQFKNPSKLIDMKIGEAALLTGYLNLYYQGL